MNADTSAAPPPSEPTNPRQVFYGARVRAYTFVQLVFESRLIVVGKVTSQASDGGSFTFSVQRSFPEGPPRQLRVSAPEVQLRGARLVPPASGESLLLFLESVQPAEATLLGAGDMGVWPRRAANWVFTEGHVRPLEEVVRVVELLLETDARKSYAKRVNALLDDLVAAGPLGRIAAAQYAADFERWGGLSKTAGAGLTEARLLVAAWFLLSQERLDPAEDYAVLQLLSSAPSSVSVPILLRRLNDDDGAARDTAFASLQTVSATFNQETFGYNPQAPAEQRLAAAGKWESWWSSHKDERLGLEVPKMLADLESPDQLRRQAADAALRLVSGREVGFQAAAPAPRRREAINRWQAWWRELSRSLD